MSNNKKFYIYKDSSGAIGNTLSKNLPINFTQTEIVSIDEDDTPSLYTVIPDNVHPFLARITYAPAGYISPDYESGCMAWVKIKDSLDHSTFRKIDLSPEWIKLYPGNVIYITGARVFDSYFTVQFEYYDTN